MILVPVLHPSERDAQVGNVGYYFFYKHYILDARCRTDFGQIMLKYIADCHF